MGAVGCVSPMHEAPSNAPQVPAQGEETSGSATGHGPSARQNDERGLCDGLAASPDAAECQKLAEADIKLNEGSVQGAEPLLVELGGGVDLDQQLQVALPRRATELEKIQRFVLARAILLRSSLSYGSGDENATRSLYAFDDLVKWGVSERLSERLTIERSRARLALGQGEEALRLIEALGTQLTGDAEVQATLGIALLATGEVKRSLVPLQRSLDLDPKEPERHLVLGTARMLDGDLDAAERNFRGALAAASKVDREPAHKVELLSRAYGDLGAVLLVKGDAEGGRVYLMRALGLMPRKATYLANLSYAEMLLGNPTEAEIVARKALAVDDQLVSAWINLGLAQVKLGKLDAAQVSFERAQHLDPSDPRPQENLLDLQQLRDSNVDVSVKD